MNIECYTITYNEEKIIRYFIDHYKQFCTKIIIYDNESTDNTRDIIKSYKDDSIILESYSSNNTLNDLLYIDIKNNCWKKTSADYVIVVDCDELLYSCNLQEYILSTRHAVYKPTGYDMISEKFPGRGNLTELVKEGVESFNYSKTCIFSPLIISEINFELGCHNSTPINKNGDIITPYCTGNELKLLHYKNLSFDYRYNKHIAYKNRMSTFNKNSGAGIHYMYDKEQQKNEFYNIYNNRKIII